MNYTQELFNKLDNIFKSNNLVAEVSNKSNVELNTYLSILFAITQKVVKYDIESELDVDKTIESIEFVNSKQQSYNQLIQVLKDNKIQINANLTGFWVETSLLEYELIIKINDEVYKSESNCICVDIYPYGNDVTISINKHLAFHYHFDINHKYQFIKLILADSLIQYETEELIPIEGVITKHYVQLK